MITGFERTCPVCGDIFIVMDPGEYVYKLKRKTKLIYLCSWSCYKKGADNHEILSMLGKDRDHKE